MRVLQVIPAIAPRYGGPSQQALGRCRALIRLGVDVLLATTSADGNSDLEVEHGRQIDFQGVPTRFFRRNFSESLKYSRDFASWIGSAVANFDAVHIDAVFSHVCWAAAAACAADAVPYVVRPLGTLDGFTFRQKAVRKRVAWHLFAARMLRGASAVVYTTETEKRDVEERLGLERGIVFPNGIDSHQVLPDSVVHERPYIVVVCRLDPIKGLDGLISAFAWARRQPGLSAWQMVIAGDGDARYVDYLRSLAASLGVGSDVRFAGWVSDEARTRLLASAQLFALLSQHENFGISVVEAMNLSVPVLISDQVQICDQIVATQSGWVTSLESGMVRQTLAAAMADVNELRRRGRRAAEAAKAYSWDNVAPRYLAMLGGLVARKSIS